jgi:hypothetical protein
MSYPSENVTTPTVVPFGYDTRTFPAPSGPWSGWAHSVTGNDTSEIKWNIHPSSGNATMVKGFKLCRAWSRTFGDMSVQCAGEGHQLRTFPPYGPPASKEEFRYIGVEAWMSGGNSLIPPPPGLPSSNMINATLVKALNKLKDQDIHVGNFIAESHKTMEMFATNAKRIAATVTSFRRKYPKDWEQVKAIQTGSLARSKWCLIPNLWLELQYGWRPLMSDIFGAIHHLSRSNRYKVPYVFAKAHSKNQKTETFSKTCRVYGGAKADLVFEINEDVWVQLVYGITSPTLAELSSLGLINPLEIVWETTRYSFVVDWFLPVSAWLSALTADVGYTFITGTRSSLAKRKFRGATKTGNWLGREIIGSVVWDYTYPDTPFFSGESGIFDRTCYLSSPVPGLYVKNPLSFEHVANGMALLTQAFR